VARREALTERRGAAAEGLTVMMPKKISIMLSQEPLVGRE
jgi:hypothetical protein